MEFAEAQLIENIKRGDYGSYNILFTQYYGKLSLYINNLIGNKADTEDIVQELFIKLWLNRKKINIQTTVSGYLYKTARNMAFNFIRDETTRKRIAGKMSLQTEFECEIADDQDFSDALNACINQLPERCKEILIMQRIKGHKQKEIAEKLNISVKTIKNQMWIAMQRLKLCIEIKHP